MRTDLQVTDETTIRTLEKTSVEICKLSKDLLKHSISKPGVVNNIICATKNLYQLFVIFICEENDIEIFGVSEDFVRKMSLHDIITPVTYERVIMSPLFSKYSEMKS